MQMKLHIEFIKDTVTMIRTTDGGIIVAYTDLPWKRVMFDEKGTGNGKSFIYSYRDGKSFKF